MATGHIERLYAVFADYAAPATMGVCPCCVTPAEFGALLARPLRELETHDLGRYPGKAMTTWGSLEDFKHFLPRLLELGLSGDDWMLERTRWKLDYSDLGSWPTAERAAVFEALAETFARAVADNDGYLASETFGLLERHGEDVQPLLADLDAAASARFAVDAYIYGHGGIRHWARAAERLPRYRELVSSTADETLTHDLAWMIDEIAAR